MPKPDYVINQVWHIIPQSAVFSGFVFPPGRFQLCLDQENLKQIHKYLFVVISKELFFVLVLEILVENASSHLFKPLNKMFS